jgi:cytochrome P450
MVERKDDFAGRPLYFPAYELLENKDLIAGDYGPLFQFRRKIMLLALHMFGEGVRTAEERVNREVDWLLKEIEATNERRFTPKKLVMTTTIRIIANWLFSEKFENEDPVLKELIDFDEDMLKLNCQCGYYQILPFLKYFPTEFMKTVAAVRTKIDNLFWSHLKHHQKTYKNGVVRDIMDALMYSYQKEKAKTPNKDLGTIDDLRFLAVDAFLGASDTTSSILSWFLLYMIRYQDVQGKLCKELDEVVGRDKLPCSQDTENLPYLRATICEVMRHSVFAPFSAPHKAIRDSVIDGYHVPKDTIVFLNHWRIHHDPKEWDEPALFKPQRFLDTNGNFVGWNTLPGFIPFGFGRRSCVGQALAKMQLFTMTSRLLHQYRFEIPDGESEPVFDGEISAVRYPKEYKLIAKKRF